MEVDERFPRDSVSDDEGSTGPPDGSQSTGDANSGVDEKSLRIRIPNPSAYLARQSNWTSRRGKPRCDSCRTNNLKCDRVLPICNHCSFPVRKSCTYTPLPTPAHRGIPRCDRCRDKNYRCDRNLPVCNHCAADNIKDCLYTPKKRHHTLGFVDAAGSSSQSNSLPIPSEIRGPVDSSAATSSHPLNIASNGQGVHRNKESSSSRAVPLSGTGRFQAVPDHVIQINDNSQKSAEPSGPLRSHYDSTVNSKSRYIQPWSHRSFAPLPARILESLRTVPTVEMPVRDHYNNALETFVESLIPELKDTTALSPDSYASVVRAIRNDELHTLSSRRRTWVTIHRLCSASQKIFLVLAPRDSVFGRSHHHQEKLRETYEKRFDSDASSESDSPAVTPESLPVKDFSQEWNVDDPDWIKPFERLAVFSQIFDILVYAHRSHAASWDMMKEVGRSGMTGITWPMAEIFVKICPTCNGARAP